MELFDRFEELTGVIARMNSEAASQQDVPYIRLHDYVHYCDLQMFLHAYTRRLRLSAEKQAELLAFCYQDTLRLKNIIGPVELYTFTFHYLKCMTYRTGNLDTPDDCVEKLDMERFDRYRLAREKEWRGEALSAEEQALTARTVQDALDACTKNT